MDLTFYYESRSDTATARIWMFVINSPGKTIIIGLPDIIEHFYYLFTEMVTSAKEDCRRIRRKEEREQTTNDDDSFRLIDLQLPIEGLEEPFIPWEDNPWVIAQEEIDTYDPCSFTGPLAYLTMSHEEAIENYFSLLDSHISPEFKEECPKVLDLMKSQLALDVFVPPTWTGIKAPPLEFQVRDDIPKFMKPAARPINPKIYEPAKKEFDRMLTYFYVKSESNIASPLVVAPKATAPWIRICGDYTPVNKYLLMPQHPMPNVRHAIVKCRQYKKSLDMDAANSYHQFPQTKELSELLSVQTPWGLFRPL